MCHNIYPVYQGIFEGQVRPSIRAMIRKGSHGALHRLPGHERWGVMGWPGSPSWSVSGTQHLVYHNWNVCDLYIDWSIYITFLFLNFYLSIYPSMVCFSIMFYLSIDLCVFLFYLSIFLSVFLDFYLYIVISFFLSFFLSIFLYFYLSFYLSLFLSFFLYFSVSFCL
jgi:hypothetical protein